MNDSGTNAFSGKIYFFKNMSNKAIPENLEVNISNEIISDNMDGNVQSQDVEHMDITQNQEKSVINVQEDVIDNLLVSQ